MKYDFQQQFFLVHDEDTGDTKLFRHWWSVVNFLTDDIMKYGYRIIYDENYIDPTFQWFSNYRTPINREECFNYLFNVESIDELNEILEDVWHIEIIKFSD